MPTGPLIKRTAFILLIAQTTRQNNADICVAQNRSATPIPTNGSQHAQTTGATSCNSNTSRHR